jgi:hypothetical protein
VALPTSLEAPPQAHAPASASVVNANDAHFEMRVETMRIPLPFDVSGMTTRRAGLDRSLNSAKMVRFRSGEWVPGAAFMILLAGRSGSRALHA